MDTGLHIDKINAAFRDAVALHKAGEISAAAARYETLRPQLPDHPQLLYLLGGAYVHLERAREAIPLLEHALKLRPDHPPTMEMAGSAWTQLNDHSKALGYFTQAAVLRPGSIDAQCRLGTTLLACGRHAEALAAFQRGLVIDPGHLQARMGEAHALRSLGHHADAEARLRDFISLNPDHAKSYALLGAVLADAERLSEAEHALRQGLTRFPEHAETHHYLATVLHRQGQLQEAAQAYRQALASGANGAEIFFQLGDVLADLGNLDEAESVLTEALKTSPDAAALLTGLGRIEELRGNLDKALDFHDKAIGHDPGHANAYINRGTARRYSGDFEGALADYDAAHALDPNMPAAAANRGLTLLTLGRLTEGWPGFKSRIKARAGSVDLSGSQPWDGSSLDGKNILVWTEYGLGDEIMFTGLLPELIARAGACTLVCSPRLVSLFRRSFPTIAVHPLGQPISGDFDVRLPLTDAAQWLRPTFGSFPTHNGYLNADQDLAERLRARYGQADRRPRVGLSWHSSGGVGTSPFKSIPLEQWMPILRVPNIKFISLQYGDREQEIRTLKDTSDIDIHLDREIDSSGDLDAFAAQVAAMDLVISVSNTAVHVAGALGIPVWAMVPTGPGTHWYWFRERADSPWYPSLKIFRQGRRGDWTQPVANVAEHLQRWRQS